MEFRGANEVVWEDAGSDHFTGQVRFGSMHQPDDDADLRVLGVHFDPGARTDWHWHPGGQVLYVTDGAGWVAARGGTRREMTSGDTVFTPPGEVHWHGATDQSHMVHLSLTWRGLTQWESEKVSDEDYADE